MVEFDCDLTVKDNASTSGRISKRLRVIGKVYLVSGFSKLLMAA
jgi:hypothetical protein